MVPKRLGAGLGERAGGPKGPGGRKGRDCRDLREERWGALGQRVAPTWMQEMGGLWERGGAQCSAVGKHWWL